MQEAKFRPAADVMSHQLNACKDSLPSADQDKQSDQRHIRPYSCSSAASSSPVPRENSSRSFVDERDIVHPEAQKFWRESFIGQSIVDVRLFSRAIKHEFEFTQEEEDAVDLIIREIDADSNGTVTLTEFNVFTKKLGLEGACRKVLSKHVKPNQAPNKTIPTSATSKVIDDEALTYYEVVLTRATGQFVGPDGL